ncbi:hypothetical protein BDB01DRAFT_797111 [Pilobolus umbonatus]|nr:hypothetical protein BDB01DRAFT_797111 [Pilobolus umbonatus]
MSVLTVYYNPRCSKCRNALAFLDENKEKYNYTTKNIVYEKEPPSREQLELIADYSNLRSKPESEKAYKTFVRSDAAHLTSSWDDTFALLEKDITKIERPFIVDYNKKKAVLGRPDVSVIEAFLKEL